MRTTHCRRLELTFCVQQTLYTSARKDLSLVHDATMARQTALSSKLHIALLALKSHCTRVRLKVVLQRRQSREPHVALLTVKWLLSSVHAHMHIQVSSMGKHFVTLLAMNRLRVGVQSEVVIKRVAL